jgi:hypothetical protein
VDQTPRPFTPVPFTPVLPSAKCVLKTNEGHLHGTYPTSLRRLVAEPGFFKYLRLKHHWTHATCKEVDWQAFRMAARNYESNDVHLPKLVHDLLPTRHHVHKCQPWTDPTCQFCSERDTFFHLQNGLCNERSRQFIPHLLSAVTTYFDAQSTPAAFRQHFSHAISRWASDDPISDLPSGVHSSQNQIGWHLLTRGFFSMQ